MAAYIVVQIDVENAAAYEEYKARWNSWKGAGRRPGSSSWSFLQWSVREAGGRRRNTGRPRRSGRPAPAPK